MKTGEERGFLVKIPAAFPCSSIWKRSNSWCLQELLQKKNQGGQIWHFWSLEFDNQDIRDFRSSLYTIKEQDPGKYELELILQQWCMFFEEHNGPWAISKAPSHFVLAYSKNYQTIIVEEGTSKWVLCCSRIINTLCGLHPSQRVFSKRLVSTKQMCNSCIIWLAPCVFREITRLLPVPTYWQKRSKCHSAVSVLTSLPLILFCNCTSATSGWMFPQEVNSLCSISVWCLCARGLIT